MFNDNLNTKYWDIFYKSKNITTKPSKFAIFCKRKLRKYKGTVYDIGCGNGRDVVFFNKKKIHCLGIDKSFQAIYLNKKKFFKFKKIFKKYNFCNFFSKQIKDCNFSVYSRFSLHTLNYKNENKLLNFLSRQKKLEYFFIETRTLDDELYGLGKKVGKHEYILSHYRRFIDSSILKKKLKKHFKILYFKKSKGFAKFKKEDPCVLRIIAKKKSI